MAAVYRPVHLAILGRGRPFTWSRTWSSDFDWGGASIACKVSVLVMDIDMQ